MKVAYYYRAPCYTFGWTYVFEDGIERYVSPLFSSSEEAHAWVTRVNDTGLEESLEPN